MTYYSHFNGNTTTSLYWTHSSTLNLSHLAEESHNSSKLILRWEPVMVSPSNTNLTHFIKSKSRGAAFPVHSMKIYSSRGMASLSFNFGTRWRWMVNFTPVPLYPCTNTHTHWIGEWVGPRAILDISVKIISPASIQTPDCPAHSLVNFTIPALKWLNHLHSMSDFRKLMFTLQCKCSKQELTLTLETPS